MKFASNPLLALALAWMLASCGGQIDVDKFPDPGRVIVTVSDPAGAPVGNVLCELKTADLLLVWRSGVTGANGRVEIGQSDGGVFPGDYALAIHPPPGYALAPGQANNIPLTVKSRETDNVAVVLVAQ